MSWHCCNNVMIDEMYSSFIAIPPIKNNPLFVTTNLVDIAILLLYVSKLCVVYVKNM